MSDGLSTEDKITLCIIRNYLDFKVLLLQCVIDVDSLCQPGFRDKWAMEL